MAPVTVGIDVVKLRPSLGLRMVEALRRANVEIATPLPANLDRLLLEFPTLVRAEAIDEISRLVLDLNLKPSVGEGHIQIEIDDHDFAPNARIVPVRKGDGVEPSIILSIGFILAIEELALAACADPRFLANIDYVNLRLRQPFSVHRYPRAKESAFVDYAGAFAANGFRHENATLTLPVTSWRMLQAQSLIAAAVRWIVLHEIAHWRLGHLGLHSHHRGVAMAHFDERDAIGLRMSVARPSVVPAALEIHRPMEMDADTLAIVSQDKFVPRAQADKYWDDAWSYIASLPPEGFANECVVSQPSPAEALRMFIVAQALVILLLERMGAVPDPEHPFPETRAFNLIVTHTRLAVFPHAKETDGRLLFGGDTEGSAAFSAFLSDTFGKALCDIRLMCNLMGVRDIFTGVIEHPREVQSINDMVSAIFRDLFRVLSHGKNAMPDVETVGAREFCSLADDVEKVRAMANSYAPD